MSEARRKSKKEYMARERAKDPEKYRRAAKRANLRKYGISLETYESLLEAQGGHCAACENTGSARGLLCVDHDHTTGAVRGLLCDRCNVALGYARESAAILRSLADYIHDHRNTDHRHPLD